MLLRVRGGDLGAPSSNNHLVQVPGHGALRLNTTDGLHHQDVLRVSEDGRQGSGPVQVCPVLVDVLMSRFHVKTLQICQTSRVPQGRSAVGIS